MVHNFAGSIFGFILNVRVRNPTKNDAHAWCQNSILRCQILINIFYFKYV